MILYMRPLFCTYWVNKPYYTLHNYALVEAFMAIFHFHNYIQPNIYIWKIQNGGAYMRDHRVYIWYQDISPWDISPRDISQLQNTCCHRLLALGIGIGSKICSLITGFYCIFTPQYPWIKKLFLGYLEGWQIWIF